MSFFRPTTEDSPILRGTKSGVQTGYATGTQQVKKHWLKASLLFVLFVLLVSLDLYKVNDYWYVSSALLAVVGFIFLFSNSMLNKILVGVGSLILALSYLPISLFEDFMVSYWIARSSALAILLLYYLFIGRKREDLLSYGDMVSGAGQAAKWTGKTGYSTVRRGSVVVKFLLFAIVTAGIYLLEVYFETLGVVITGFALLVIAALLFFKKGLVGKLLGLISLILALPNIAEFVSGMREILDILFVNSYFGIDTWPRYILIAIIAFYWQFRKKARAQTNVQQI
ncbi:hypothetical protein AUJ84_00905 [Candidatus Pacearchaeota archaeon CG1_02_32_132]|nr:MAG: hypothetical protein AUJ84_00905 [Candidatus Pacearchaeota archaeon CG1_02_32_132]